MWDFEFVQKNQIQFTSVQIIRFLISLTLPDIFRTFLISKQNFWFLLRQTEQRRSLEEERSCSFSLHQVFLHSRLSGFLLNAVAMLVGHVTLTGDLSGDTHLCSSPPQWGFHSSLTSADLRMCWTTPAACTSTRRRTCGWECGRALPAAAAPQKRLHACLVQVVPEWQEPRSFSCRSWKTRVWLFVPLTPPLLRSSQAHAPRQPMGGGLWERRRLVPGGAGRRAACYHLSPWQRGDQVG